MKFYKTSEGENSIHRVAVYLQDDKHKGTVYVEIAGISIGKEVLDRAIREVLYGDIYSDKLCSMLLQDDYIPIYKYPRKKKEFVYLLERKFSEHFIIGVMIIDRIMEDQYSQQAPAF